MKKLITIILTLLSALLILDSMNAFDALAMFYLAGIIPGTHVALSAQFMLEVFTLLLGFVLARLAMNISARLRFVKRNNALRP